ncbi:interleukin-10 [Platysternon megacephalum]|uniref:Interleukin-10 n=1 Tax=Platysternon megacephalum TaxID=55544 RepID=A0A4D9E443_9SAUR|nr:interleukin-10 [Platysternon megacephalum]
MERERERLTNRGKEKQPEKNTCSFPVAAWEGGCRVAAALVNFALWVPGAALLSGEGAGGSCCSYLVIPMPGTNKTSSCPGVLEGERREKIRRQLLPKWREKGWNWSFLG